MLLPLLPLALELWFSGKIEAKSAALTAALYSIAIGLSSRNVAMFGAGVLLSFVFSAAFGFLSTQLPLEHARLFSCAAIAIVFGVHIIERYRRHVVNQREFFDFLRAD
ncbi:hypothetical protein D0T23_13890 [Duganella sp. BJB475]|nr:hypothetical protein D0T23_13890 [Duganella sp. BJB475]RFP31426.1 hypothetical protein D0T21_16270 [Duganella sp. BJB476]